MAALEGGRAAADFQVRARMSAEMTKAGVAGDEPTVGAAPAAAEMEGPKAKRRTNPRGAE
jgi:hypothetical protein